MPPPSYTRKSTRGDSWTEEGMRAALNAVLSGQLTKAAACKKYNIPEGTLRPHAVKGCFEKKRLGRKPIFTEAQEADFAARIIRYSTISVPLKPRFIRRQAFLYCEEYGINNNFSRTTKIAGEDWLKHFLERNPSIAEKVPRAFSPTQKVYKFIVMEHFRTIKNLIDELGISGYPERLYSMDVKGCRINLDSPKTIKKGSKKVQLVDTESDDVIIAMCVNAIGAAIPPMILFNGKRLRNDMSKNLPPGTLVRMVSKGNITSDLLVEFIQHLGKFKIAGKCLLVFDGAKYELSMNVLDEADRNDIVLYCLPSRTSHELQPLDKSVKKAYDHHWNDAVTNFSHSTSDKKMKKDTFNRVFSQVWSKCTTTSVIVEGFEATGLFPFNPEAIPERAYVTMSTEIPQQSVQDPESDENTGNLHDVSVGKGRNFENNESVKSLDKNLLNYTNCDGYGKYVSKQLENMDKTQRMLLKTLINDTLYMAKLGKLTPFHSINCRDDGETDDMPVVTATCNDIKEEIDETAISNMEVNSEQASLQSVPKKENDVVITTKGKRVTTKEIITETPIPKRPKTSVSEEVDNDNTNLVMNCLAQPGSYQFTVVEVERMDDDEITIKEEHIEAGVE